MRFTINLSMLNAKRPGLRTIYIAYTLNRKTSWRATNVRVLPAHWDPINQRVRKTNTNHQYLNALLDKERSEFERNILSIAVNGERLPATFASMEVKRQDFESFALSVRGDKRTTRTEILRIKQFFNDRNPDIKELDLTFLRRYHNHLQVTEHKPGKFYAHNTIAGSFVFLRRILNAATAEGFFKENPMREFVRPRAVQNEAVWCEDKEKEAMMKLLLKLAGVRQKPVYYSTLAYFLLACYTGFRHSDWEKFGSDRLFKTGKGEPMIRLRATKNNNDIVMPVGKTLQQIVDIILHENLKPVSISTCNNYHLPSIARDLKLTIKLTTHKGRHSFGFMCASNGIPKSTTAELMGIDLQTVEVYYHLTGSNITAQAATLACL